MGGRYFSWGPELHEQRKLTHFIDIDAHKGKLKDITTFGLVPRKSKYDSKKNYSIGGSFAFYGKDVLDGYDYITANANCYNILSTPSRFPDGWAFNYAKASVWGRDKSPYIRSPMVGRPEGKDFYDSRISINIPHELILTVFKDMPIGGRK